MSNHTPGPWTVAGLPRQYDEAINANGPVCIARIPRAKGRDHITEEEVDANARLIAAAPDLLTAAKAMVECLFCLTTEQYSKAGERAAREALKAAIEKADGTTCPACGHALALCICQRDDTEG